MQYYFYTTEKSRYANNKAGVLGLYLLFAVKFIKYTLWYAAQRKTIWPL